MTWGTLHLFLTKQSVTVNESEMTFGQILPIVLLVAPLLPVARAIIPLLLHPFELWPMAFLAVSHPPGKKQDKFSLLHWIRQLK